MNYENFIKGFMKSKMGIKEEDKGFIAIKVLFEEFCNEFMKQEREVYLSKEEKDKGNGYYKRGLSTGIGKIKLNVPRTREGNFRPYILPPLYKRTDESYKILLSALIENGYSESELENFFKEMELPYSREEMEKIKEGLKERMEDFRTRQL